MCRRTECISGIKYKLSIGLFDDVEINLTFLSGWRLHRTGEKLPGMY